MSTMELQEASGEASEILAGSAGVATPDASSIYAGGSTVGPPVAFDAPDRAGLQVGAIVSPEADAISVAKPSPYQPPEDTSCGPSIPPLMNLGAAQDEPHQIGSRILDIRVSPRPRTASKEAAERDGDGVPLLGADGQVQEGLKDSEWEAHHFHPHHHHKNDQTMMFQFGNTEAIKDKVRAAKSAGRKAAYDVKDKYKEKGFFQWVAKHQYFENFTLGTIVFNALWISIDTDGNTAATILDAKALYVVADIMFFGYFSIELIIRFVAFQHKCDCVRDPWFVFDGTLVALYAFDPFVIGLITAIQGGSGLDLPTAVLRLFRLARLSRLVRMLRSLPELMIMIKGMFSAAASVGYTLGLLMLITYVFSIALRNLVPVDPADDSIETMYFSTMPEAMHNLLVYAVFLDALSDFVINTKIQSTACFILVWLYICVASMTILNMLIGVLCEVIQSVAEEERESMMVDKVNDKFSAIVTELDKNSDGSLSWTEFEDIMQMPEAIQALESVNVDPATMVDMAEDFFWDDQGQTSGESVPVSFDQFMDMVLDLRGGQQATVENIMSLAKRFNRKFLILKNRLDKTDQKIEGIDVKLETLLRRKAMNSGG